MNYDRNTGYIIVLMHNGKVVQDAIETAQEAEQRAWQLTKKTGFIHDWAEAFDDGLEYDADSLMP